MLRDWLLDLGRAFLRPVTVLRGVERSDLRPDLVAGLTVSVVLLPQAMAYATVAELPVSVGLFAAIVGTIVAALWGSSHHLQTGPTNAASLLVLSSLVGVAAPGTPQYLLACGTLAVLSGLARVLMGAARLGVLVSFIADSVIIGFTSGIALLIVGSQLRTLLGLDIPGDPSFFSNVAAAARHISATNFAALLLGAGTVVSMAIMRRMNRKIPGALIAMIGAAAAATLLELTVTTVGALPRALPAPRALPLLDISHVEPLISGALAIAAMGLVEALSIARAMSVLSGQQLDSNQEFIGQGLANIAAGFFSGYPCSGSFTRSALVYQSGGRTPMANVFAALTVLVAMLLFAPWAAQLPRAALAGVLIITAYRMIDFGEIKRIARSSRGDTLILGATTVATLAMPLRWAVLTGIVISLGRYVVRSATPAVIEVVPDNAYRHLVVRPDRPSCPQLAIFAVRGSLYFGAVQHVERELAANLREHPDQRYLMLRLGGVDHSDVSGIRMLESVVRRYREHGGDVFICSVRPPVRQLMTATGFDEQLGLRNLLTGDDAIAHLFFNVLDPLYCVHRCATRVFAECQAVRKGAEVDDADDMPQLEPLEDLADEGGMAVDELARALERGDDIALIDVREPEEHARGHIAQATPLPLRELVERRAELPETRPLVLVCRTGRRSAHGLRMLAGHISLDNVHRVRGGMLAWQAAGLPLEVEASEP